MRGFAKGHTETKEEKLYRIKRMKEAWKNRAAYIKDIKDPKLYNIWRGFKFTKKGKKAGCSQVWNSYKNFYNDMFPTFSSRKRLIRIDKSKSFSKRNCMWATDEEASNLRGDNILIEYNGEKKTFRDWGYSLNRSMHGIRDRYYKHGNTYSTQEILFGKKRIPKREITSAKDLEWQLLKTKASKMCSAYRHRDFRKGYENNLTNEWLINNILLKRCVYCGTNEQIGCDRIENQKGHTIDNVVPCCITCNYVRNDKFSYEEMLILGKTVKKIMETRTDKKSTKLRATEFWENVANL